LLRFGGGICQPGKLLLTKTDDYYNRYQKYIAKKIEEKNMVGNDEAKDSQKTG